MTLIAPLLVVLAMSAAGQGVVLDPERTPEELAKRIAQEERTDARRDAQFKIDTGLDTLDIRPGMLVAEVGAGSGYLAFKLAARVGPRGMVIAEDISTRELGILKVRAQAKGLSTLDVIPGSPEDPKLPADSLDLVFMHAVIKFVQQPVALFRNVAKSLKPGGRFVLLEFEEGPRAIGLDGSPALGFRTRQQYLELFEEAGFKVLRIDDATLPALTIFVLGRR
jgi:ubiquinone/menaquinone biosynthesis C-methylase UbiE